MKINVLAFGVHPDDVELSCSGFLLKAKSEGLTTGIIDLTQGEMGTRGSSEKRFKEAANSAKILGVDIRENLNMKDCFFENNQEHQLKIVEQIRKYQPDIILCNAPRDRHPDHGRSAQLVIDANFYAGLRKIDTNQPVWRGKNVWQYIQDQWIMPDFAVDISTFFETKMESINAFDSQFYNPNSDEPDTYIASKNFLLSVESRAREFGRLISAEFAEGFISTTKMQVKKIGNYL